MTSRVLVCPFQERVIRGFEGKTLVVKSEDPDEIAIIPREVHRLNNKLHSVFLRLESSITCISTFEEWKGIPVAVQAPEIGDFLEFATKLHLLQGLNLRVFLSLEKEENYLFLRVLSSLCVPTTIVFNGGNIDWDSLCDLMTYALLGKVPHAGIEPFQTIAETYAPHRRTDIGGIYFDDPSRYLHLDKEGHVALTSGDLSAGRFIARSISDLPDLEYHPAYVEHMDAWKNLMLRRGECASCEGWRICLGRFSANTNDYPGCKHFFTELLGIVEKYQLMQEKRDVPCRA